MSARFAEVLHEELENLPEDWKVIVKALGDVAHELENDPDMEHFFVFLAAIQTGILRNLSPRIREEGDIMLAEIEKNECTAH